MTLIASGVFKKVFLKRQTAQGAQAPAGPASSARNVRRVTSTFDLAKASYQSNEVNESQQVRDMRHGVKSTAGTLSGELSVGGYQQPLESVLRQVSQAGVTTAALTTIAAATTGDRTGTFTRTGGSFLADGFKIGDVIRSTGWATTAAVMNTRNFMIIGLTATVMTVMSLGKAGQVVTKAAGDPVVIAVPGRKTWTPQTGQTRDYYTLEHWFGDVAKSEVFPDLVFTAANIGLPPSGLATIELPGMGIDMQTPAAQYFTSPAPSPTGAILAAVNGLIIVNGVAVGLITGLNINIAGNYAYPDANGVVGQDTHVDIVPGVLTVTGQATVLFTDATLRDMFINESEVSIAVALTASADINAEFAAFVMSRVKFSGSTKDDTPTGITLTMPFQALENVNGGAALANLQTTLSIQDSLWV